MAADRDRTAIERAGSRRMSMAEDWDVLYRHPLADHPARAMFPAFEEWASADPAPHFSIASPWKAFMPHGRPGFHIAGWFDLFCEGRLRTWQALSSPSASGTHPRRSGSSIGPWTHAGLFLEGTPECLYGATAGPGADTRGEALRWLRRAVDGDEVEPASGCSSWARTSGAMRRSWPPPSTPDAAVPRRRCGLRCTPGRRRSRVVRLRPARPSAHARGRTLGPVPAAGGPVDQRPLEDRDDVVVYTTEPLRARHHDHRHASPRRSGSRRRAAPLMSRSA